MQWAGLSVISEPIWGSYNWKGSQNCFTMKTNRHESINIFYLQVDIYLYYHPFRKLKRYINIFFFPIFINLQIETRRLTSVSLLCYAIDQFGFKNIISLHPPYLGGFQEHDKRWVFQTMYCFSSGTGVCLGHCIIFCLSWKPPRYGGRHALETELVYTSWSRRCSGYSPAARTNVRS